MLRQVALRYEALTKGSADAIGPARVCEPSEARVAVFTAPIKSLQSIRRGPDGHRETWRPSTDPRAAFHRTEKNDQAKDRGSFCGLQSGDSQSDLLPRIHGGVPHMLAEAGCRIAQHPSILPPLFRPIKIRQLEPTNELKRTYRNVVQQPRRSVCSTFMSAFGQSKIERHWPGLGA